MAKRQQLESLDHCKNSSFFRAYRELVDFDALKFRAEREVIEFAGNHINNKAQRKNFLKLFRMSIDDYVAGDNQNKK